MTTHKLTLSGFLALMALLLHSLTTTAQTTKLTTAPLPAWLPECKNYTGKPADRDINDGYYLALMENIVNQETKERYIHIIREIVSETGVQNASQIEINFNPAYEKLTIHKIIIWRDGVAQGRIDLNKFKVVANETELSKFIYNGEYTAYLILDDIRKGDKVEFAYSRKGRNPILEDKVAEEFYFGTGLPVSHVHNGIVYSKGRKINKKNINCDLKETRVENNGLATLTWDDYDVKTIQFDGNEPSWFNPYKSIQLSEYRGWGEVATWANNVNTAPVILGGSLGARINEMKKESKNNVAAFFRLALNMVQNEVRYMGVEIGPYSHKANSPEKVYEQRYGDCKDKSLLLVSILRYVNIPANIMLVNTDMKGTLSNMLPTPFAFDHAVVQAMIGGKLVCADATISYQGGYDENVYFPDYAQGLVLIPGNNILTDIPVPETGEEHVTERYFIENKKQGVRFEVTTEYTGNEADDMRYTLSETSKSKLEKSFLDYYTKIYPGIEQTDTITVNDERENNKITIIEKYEVQHFLETDSITGERSADLYAYQIRDRLPLKQANRKNPLSLKYPLNLKYDIELHLPVDWSISLNKFDISRKAYSFKGMQYAKDNIFYMKYELQYHQDFVAAADINQLTKDVKQINSEYLSFAFVYTPEGAVSHPKEEYTGFNYVALIICILIIAGSFFVFRKIAFTESKHSIGNRYPMQIDGWLVPAALCQLLTTLIHLYYIFNSGYFSATLWDAYKKMPSENMYKGLIIYEIMYYTATICFALFTIYLLLRQRDILPRIIIIFYITCMGGLLLDDVLHVLLLKKSLIASDYQAIVYHLLVCCVWIPYFRIAERVKNTFVVPHISGDDYIRSAVKQKA